MGVSLGVGGAGLLCESRFEGELRANRQVASEAQDFCDSSGTK